MSMTNAVNASVLIPSFGRPGQLRSCLEALAKQARPADELLVVWQGDDIATRDAAVSFRDTLPALRVLHSPTIGVVPAENVALDASRGDIVLLIDDDAIAPTDWLARHLSHYENPTVGAVGGPADNIRPDGSAFPRRDREPIGLLLPSGRSIGNMYDQPIAWRTRPVRQVHHLVGYNMSLRRVAFDRFEPAMRPYWQMFELDACLQVRQRGYRVLFDFANVVAHHPTNTAYTGGRDGDQAIKCVNPAFNHALLLSKHTRGRFARFRRLLYLLAVGTVNSPGLAGWAVATVRYGHPLRELKLLSRCIAARLEGWREGRVT